MKKDDCENRFPRLPFGCFLIGPTGPTGPEGPQVSTYETTISGKNTSGVVSNMVFYTTTSPASGWHIVIDDGEL